MLAGCSSVTGGLQGTESGGEASVYLGPDTIRVEAGSTVVTGQVAATDLEGNGLEDADEVDPTVGKFRFEDDTDRLVFAEGSLRSLAFEVDGGTATVYRGGQIVTRDVSTFSRQFATPSPSPSPTPTPRPGTVVDGFERSSLGPYTGRTSAFRVQKGTAFTGDRALAIERIGAGIYSTSGLPAYPSAGDRFRFACRFGGSRGRGPDIACRFGVQSEDPGRSYAINVGRLDTGLKLSRRNGSESIGMAREDIEAPTNEWLLVTLDWGNDGTLRAVLHDTDGTAPGRRLASVKATDSTYTDGGIGWRGNDDAGTVRYVDALRRLPSEG
jgi:hypothetical protein